MTTSAPGQPSSNGRAATAEAGAGRRGAQKKGKPDRNSARRLSVDRVLPSSLVEKLRKAVAGESPLSREQVERLDERFGIAKRYGVSRLRLRNWPRGVDGPV